MVSKTRNKQKHRKSENKFTPRQLKSKNVTVNFPNLKVNR